MTPTRIVRYVTTLLALLIVTGCTDVVLDPLSPDEVRRQVTDVSRQIVSDLGGEIVEAKLLYDSCGINGKPPFKGHGKLYLWMPGADRTREVTAESVTQRLHQHGWATNPDFHSHALAFERDGHDVTVQVIPQPKSGKKPFAHVLVDVYGECRDTFDHRTDGSAFSSIDISSDVTPG